MLAQDQSSSAKKGGLVADVSSGLIFLKKKKKNKKRMGEELESMDNFFEELCYNEEKEMMQ